MKVFFIGERRYKENVALNTKVIALLEKNDCIVDKSLLKASHEEDFTHFEQAYKRNVNSIKNCDVVVAEVSGTTSGIGFLLATALNYKKPVLALFNRTLKQKPPLTLKGVNSKLFVFEEYSEDNLKTILQKSLAQIRQKLDTKFILIIPAEIDHYLEWASDYKRMHKAQLVREAVEGYMMKDKSWQEFLKDDSAVL